MIKQCTFINDSKNLKLFLAFLHCLKMKIIMLQTSNFKIKYCFLKKCFLVNIPIFHNEHGFVLKNIPIYWKKIDFDFIPEGKCLHWTKHITNKNFEIPIFSNWNYEAKVLLNPSFVSWQIPCMAWKSPTMQGYLP